MTNPAEEAARLEALRNYDVAGTGAEKAYDDVVLLASQICDTPMAAVSFLENDHQWFKAELGLDVTRLPLEESLCAHTVLEKKVLVVPDTRRDERFAEHPLVTGAPHLRFYAGAPLVTAEGLALGTLCVIDKRPRELSPAQQKALRALSRQVMNLLELRRTASRLRESEARFRAFMDNGPMVSFIKDEAGRMVYANKPFERRFKLSREKWRNKDDFELWPPEVAAPLRDHDLGVLAGAKTLKLTESVPTPDGEVQHWQVYKFPLRLGERSFVAGMALDITEMKRHEERLEARRRKLEAANAHLNVLGTTDGLTGLKNRRAFDETLARAFDHAKEYDEPLSLLLIDVDEFKSYNDAFGHPAGDDALRRIARSLVERARKDELVARYGGEEMAAILPRANLRNALAVAERFRSAVETTTWGRREVTISVGAATLTRAMTDAHALVEAADAALYRAKRAGRNCVRPHANTHSPAAQQGE